MMRLKNWWIGLVVLCLLGVTGCFENPNDFSKQGVCVVNGTAVWTEASNKSQWLSSLALGETVQLEGKPVKDMKDSKQREYIKVKLSDGTSGYSSTGGIVQGAYVGVTQNPAKVYKRPDLLADTGQSLDVMAIVAVQEEKSDWLRVTGEEWGKSGWITKDSIRKDKEDVVTAVILRKALRGKGTAISKEDLEKIITTVPDRDNYFVTKVLEKYQALDTTPLETPAGETPPDTQMDSESGDQAD
jgi:hypothetical protein